MHLFELYTGNLIFDGKNAEQQLKSNLFLIIL